MKILITGCAGFIGFHLIKKILQDSNHMVFGIDNLNDYYDVQLKKDRLNLIKRISKKFKFFKIDISNKKKIHSNFLNNKYDIVINLAAQAGVRYSIDNPSIYLDSNINGFFNILEASQKNKIKHLIYASTSSVYGDNNLFPLKEDFNTDKPLSFYAATKKCNEIMAYSFSNIYKLPSTGLRFFTVYGPYGRPDMSLYKFTKNIKTNKNVYLYNKGNHLRDFTYIDDLTDYIFKLINKIPKKRVPYEIYNIGSGKPKHLKYFLNVIEKTLQKKAKVKYLGMQKGDVHKTHADVFKINNKVGKIKTTNFDSGIKKFIEWFKNRDE